MGKSKDKTAASVWIRKDLLEKVDTLAAKAELTRSKLLSNVLETAVEELILCDKIGVFQFGILLRDMKSALQGWVTTCYEDRENVGEISYESTVLKDGEFIPIEEALKG